MEDNWIASYYMGKANYLQALEFTSEAGERYRGLGSAFLCRLRISQVVPQKTMSDRQLYITLDRKPFFLVVSDSELQPDGSTLIFQAQPISSAEAIEFLEANAQHYSLDVAYLKACL